MLSRSVIHVRPSSSATVTSHVLGNHSTMLHYSYFHSHASFAVHFADQDMYGSDLLGCFYIKPNFPGRCSHVCNGGFITNPQHRGLGVGTFMGENFKILGVYARGRGVSCVCAAECDEAHVMFEKCMVRGIAKFKPLCCGKPLFPNMLLLSHSFLCV